VLRALAVMLCAVATQSAVGAPAYAQQQQASANKLIVVDGKPQKKERMICKSSAPPTGSRMGGGRVCHTAQEWKLAEEQSERSLDSYEQKQRAEGAYEQNARGGLGASGPRCAARN
jgi:hypothetical protein